MDYSRLLNRAWTMIWTHKFLILLGVLAALGGGGVGNNFSWRLNDGNSGNRAPFTFGEGTFTGFPVALLILLIGFAIALALVLWVIGTVARGGLVTAVDGIESGGQASFMTAWAAGWHKVWPLLGIALLPAIPILVLVVAGLLATGVLAGFATLAGVNLAIPLRTGLAVVIGAFVCIAVPFALVLTLLRNFAERACMLENLGVLPAYRRGWDVLVRNLGPAILLFLIQIVLTILLAIVMIGPGLVIALCCLLWPVLLLIGGGVAAYFSTLWTLAWREWTVGTTSGAEITSTAPGI
jgi:hypothetical protein